MTRRAKAAYFNGRGEAACEATGQPVAWSDAHVDRAGEWPFRRIAADWIAARGGLPLTKEDGMSQVLACEADARSFRAFHDERARLRVVHRIVNLTAERPDMRKTGA